MYTFVNWYSAFVSQTLEIFLRHALRADLVSPFSAQRSSVGLLAALGTAGIG
jgi:hypothetical protein